MVCRFVEAVCRLHAVRLVKTVRLRVRQAAPLLAADRWRHYPALVQCEVQTAAAGGAGAGPPGGPGLAPPPALVQVYSTVCSTV